jgi:hypothetical protein
MAAPFTRQAESSQPREPRAWKRWLKPVLAVMVLVLALRILLVARHAIAPVRSEARGYLRLRRAYEKSGFPVRAHDAPLAFLAGLRAAHAPGLQHAERVIAGYLKARFSGAEINAAEQRALAEELRAALSALRKWRADPAKRAKAA